MKNIRIYQSALWALMFFCTSVLYSDSPAFSADNRLDSDSTMGVQKIVDFKISGSNFNRGNNVIAGEVKPQNISSVSTIFSVEELHNQFRTVSFDLATVRQGKQMVPRFFANRLPNDLKSLSNSADLKRTFFQMVLPLILKVNEEILAERQQLFYLRKKVLSGKNLAKREQRWLKNLADHYGTIPNNLNELILRVDAVSPSLALAQSAEESGWGRSRFALSGNALFGQKTWNKGLGIIPQKRDNNGRYEVLAFPSLLDSVRSYAHNLNAHRAYTKFRKLRAEMRLSGSPLNPYKLVEALKKYSERRGNYVLAIQKILRIDNLEELENAYLERPPSRRYQKLSES